MNSLKNRYIRRILPAPDVPHDFYNLIKHTSPFTAYCSYFYCDHTSKFARLAKFMENPFISKANKETFLIFFSNVQRRINAFKNLVRRWRIKRKYIVCPVTTDFTGNELSTYKPHLTIDLIECNVVYSFYIHDLLNIWNRALRMRSYVIEQPQTIMNPYTNVPFSINNLYNIYYKALFNGTRIYNFINLHYLSGFSIKKMLCIFGAQFREEAIIDYAKSGDLSTYYELSRIYAQYRPIMNNVYISDSLPNDIKTQQIIEFKTIILIYCILNYSNNSNRIEHYRDKLEPMIIALNNKREQEYYV